MTSWTSTCPCCGEPRLRVFKVVLQCWGCGTERILTEREARVWRQMPPLEPIATRPVGCSPHWQDGNWPTTHGCGCVGSGDRCPTHGSP